MAGRIKIGISACLLGEFVRYDGGHKRDPVIIDALAPYVDWVSVCPEVEAGWPVPRDPFRLEGDPEAPRLVIIESGEDASARLRRWVEKRLRELEDEDLGGFVFKKGSPSCGIEGVEVFAGKGALPKTGRGIFAAAFMEHFPLRPVEEEGRLHDPVLRENFLERILAGKQ
jgi:uncharacterized protein YbbK (DUF523 family)